MKAAGTMLPPLWKGHETPLPCTDQQSEGLQLVRPIPIAALPSWRGLLLACALHCCLLALCLGDSDAQLQEVGEPACEITLVGFSGGGAEAAATQSPVQQNRQNALPPVPQQAGSHTLHKPEPTARPVQQRTAHTPVSKRKPSQEQRSAATAAPKVATTSKAGNKPTGSGSAPQNAHATTPGDGSGSTGNASGQDGAYTPGNLDHAPALLRRVRPEYPAEAKKKKIEGRVVVRLIVDSRGMPTQCSVHSATPPGTFEAAALEAARKLRFSPGRKGGRAVPTLVLLPFDFRLR